VSPVLRVGSKYQKYFATETHGKIKPINIFLQDYSDGGAFF
jgi:hypothetical protein